MTMRTVTLDILHVTAFEKNQSVACKEEADLYWTTGYSLYRRLRGKQGSKVMSAERNKTETALCLQSRSHIHFAINLNQTQ
jgi:hypothetical protein